MSLPRSTAAAPRRGENGPVKGEDLASPWKTADDEEVVWRCVAREDCGSCATERRRLNPSQTVGEILDEASSASARRPMIQMEIKAVDWTARRIAPNCCGASYRQLRRAMFWAGMAIYCSAATAYFWTWLSAEGKDSEHWTRDSRE
jgi:hypothetical protein